VMSASVQIRETILEVRLDTKTKYSLQSCKLTGWSMPGSLAFAPYCGGDPSRTREK
jgi:hypothetical protein